MTCELSMNAPLPLPIVEPLDRSLRDVLSRMIDAKTKPPGSLGMLEVVARQMGMIQQTTRPSVTRPAMIVFAGDHGIAKEGVSSYPQEVTAQMVANFLSGGAAINALSRSVGMALEVVDAGVATPIPIDHGYERLSLGLGTRNFAREPAMSRETAPSRSNTRSGRCPLESSVGRI